MTKQYFYSFAQGSYSDYSINGLFICDHEVDEKEWHECYKAWQVKLQELRDVVPKVAGVFPEMPNYVCEDYNSHEYKIMDEFRDTSPEEEFQKLHNMVQIEYQEFWRDS